MQNIPHSYLTAYFIPVADGIPPFTAKYIAFRAKYFKKSIKFDKRMKVHSDGQYIVP
jgi:hypothetical protein